MIKFFDDNGNLDNLIQDFKEAVNAEARMKETLTKTLIERNAALAKKSLKNITDNKEQIASLFGMASKLRNVGYAIKAPQPFMLSNVKFHIEPDQEDIKIVGAPEFYDPNSYERIPAEKREHFFDALSNINEKTIDIIAEYYPDFLSDLTSALDDQYLEIDHFSDNIEQCVNDMKAAIEECKEKNMLYQEFEKQPELLDKITPTFGTGAIEPNAFLNQSSSELLMQLKKATATAKATMNKDQDTRIPDIELTGRN